MNPSRTRRSLAAFVLLLLAGFALVVLLLVGIGRLPPLASTDSPDMPGGQVVGREAVEFANRFVRLDGPEAFEQRMQLASRSLRTLYDQADALDRQRASQPNPDAADLNPAYAPPVVEKPAMAERGAWIFGRVDAWQPGQVRLREADAGRASVDVDLQVLDAPTVVPARLLLVHEDGGWRLDDVLHGRDGADGSLRGSLREIH